MDFKNIINKIIKRMTSFEAMAFLHLKIMNKILISFQIDSYVNYVEFLL